MIDRGQNWGQAIGAHYRELAGLLREVAATSQLTNPQLEILNLALAYVRKAEYFPLPFA